MVIGLYDLFLPKVNLLLSLIQRRLLPWAIHTVVTFIGDDLVHPVRTKIIVLPLKYSGKIEIQHEVPLNRP